MVRLLSCQGSEQFPDLRWPSERRCKREDSAAEGASSSNVHWLGSSRTLKTQSESVMAGIQEEVRGLRGDLKDAFQFVAISFGCVFFVPWLRCSDQEEPEGKAVLAVMSWFHVGQAADHQGSEARTKDR